MTMHDDIPHLMAEQVQQHGPWTAANFELSPGTYTIRNGIVRDEVKLRRLIQLLSDLSRKPLNTLRILDLACLEGLYAVELALHGATVVANDIRLRNVAITAFVKEMLGAERLEIRHDDVRNLSKARYGEFDVVLCQGILYHLDTPASFALLENIHDVCTGFVVIDTHYATKGTEFRSFRGQQYRGSVTTEHSPGSSAEQKMTKLWASIDNEESFWFCRDSLYNLLADIGFSSVFECHWPSFLAQEPTRAVFVAMRGSSIPIRSTTLINSVPHDRYPL